MRYINGKDSYIYITTYKLVSGRNEARDKIIHIHYMMRHSVVEVVTKQQKYGTLKPRHLKRYTGDDVRDVKTRYVPTKLLYRTEMY